MKQIKVVPALVIGALTIACATTPTPRPAASPIVDPETALLQGTWDLVVRGKAAPLAFVDSHELQLRVVNGQLLGVWDIAKEWTAGVGTVFENGNRRCQERRRFLVRLESSKEHLLVVGRPLPQEVPSCGTALRLQTRWTLRTEGRQLIARASDGQTLSFHRRRHASVPLAILLHGHGKLTGVWTWHHRSLDREGDLKIEHETWHLFQRGKRVEGYYDRVVAIRSRDGRHFVCNNDSGYSNRARFLVKGKIVGNEFMLKEISYVIHPGDCDTGRRTLDRYVGMVNTHGSEILLRWRTGGQVLQRRR